MRPSVSMRRIASAALLRGLAVAWLLAAFAAQAKCDENAASGGAVLDRFVGNWKTETHIQHLSSPPREITTQGKATCQTTLGGRFYEFRSETIPPGESELQVMTYDPETGTYRQWVFSSDGYTHEAVGRWDDASSTLRWKGVSGNGTVEIDDYWVSPDRLEWTMRRSDDDGDVVQTIEGTVTRQP